MEQLELNVIESFRLAKSDIIKVQSAINAMSRKQEELISMIDDLRIREAKLNEQIKNLSGKVTDTKQAVVENSKKIENNKKVTLIQQPKTITRTRTIIKRINVRSKPRTIIKRVMVPAKTRTIVRKVMVAAKRAKLHYYASKNGNKVHHQNCPFGKNIKPKLKLTFKSKTTAFNKGYKACDCLKKV